MENGNYFRINQEEVRWGVKLRDVVESGLLPTPIAGDWKGQKRSDGTASMLSGKASLGLLPTPMAQSRQTTKEQTEQRQIKYGGKTRAMYLENFAAMGWLPTPMASEGTKLSGNPKENQMSMTKIAFEMTGKTSQLNPQFVAEMMGFPTNWTELPFLIGEKNQSKDTEMP
jgi:hypothetical protein